MRLRPSNIATLSFVTFILFAPAFFLTQPVLSATDTVPVYLTGKIVGIRTPFPATATIGFEESYLKLPNASGKVGYGLFSGTTVKVAPDGSLPIPDEILFWISMEKFKTGSVIVRRGTCDETYDVDFRNNEELANSNNGSVVAGPTDVPGTWSFVKSGTRATFSASLVRACDRILSSAQRCWVKNYPMRLSPRLASLPFTIASRHVTVTTGTLDAAGGMVLQASVVRKALADWQDSLDVKVRKGQEVYMFTFMIGKASLRYVGAYRESPSCHPAVFLTVHVPGAAPMTDYAPGDCPPDTYTPFSPSVDSFSSEAGILSDVRYDVAQLSDFDDSTAALFHRAQAKIDNAYAKDIRFHERFSLVLDRTMKNARGTTYKFLSRLKEFSDACVIARENGWSCLDMDW